MKKYNTIILLFLFWSIALHAQQDLTITSGAAGTTEVGGIEYTWTLGEIVIEEVSLNSTSVVTQGFHQGNLPFTLPKQQDVGTSVSIVITPGLADGVNDDLHFSELDSMPASNNNDIIIFNRWGQVVFTAEPYLNDWKGTNQNGSDLPEGTYYFVLSIHGVRAKPVIHGNVLVIR